MTTGRLLWGTTWRGGVWGAVAGLILGAIYGPMLVVILTALDIVKQTTPLDAKSVTDAAGLALVGAIIGALFGLPTGVFAGVMNGLAIGILTRLFFAPLKNPVAYRWGIAVVSAVFTGIAGALGLVVILLLIGAVLDPQLLLLTIPIPAITASIAAAFLSILITRWYLKENAKMSH